MRPALSRHPVGRSLYLHGTARSRISILKHLVSIKLSLNDHVPGRTPTHGLGLSDYRVEFSLNVEALGRYFNTSVCVCVCGAIFL